MTIILNGQTTKDYPAPLPVSELIALLPLNKVPVIVELNGIALRPIEHETSIVQEGAIVEIVRIAA